ncbi:hypothetical protein EV643_104178 [Kribbella sp. VKM Ac-2527]|uniref:Uncharacterized protein n=1 Tax=Kribbella caucasensis TaxID=2512215 RepID=A0A4R6KMW9_9ACTN|nr:hypothetical protein [Kribbella sp. VKM Ac-2527]TDO50685.1 hypothetical protein EV643_104178 [Kribbella sp. VKM Ac-2527]
MRRAALVAAIVVVALGSAGCGGSAPDSDSAPPAGATTPSDTPSPSATPSGPAITTPKPTPQPKPTPRPVPTATTPTGPVLVAKGQTSPGARLRFGRKAIVPIRDYDSFTHDYTVGVLGITVGPIQRVPATQLEGNYDAASRARLKGRTAYYSRIVITNESGNDMSSIVKPAFDGLRRNGQNPDLVLLGGDIPSCPENVSSPDTFDHKGATWVVCHFEVSSASRPVRMISYEEPPYGLEIQIFDNPAPRYNQFYNLGPITWR